jgi:peptidoglycan/xylan/chitin deacetylase (PgdA/CDA1 family)
MHGYTHEFVSDLSEEQERDVLAKSIDVITKFTGKKPGGWTAPAWTTSPLTVNILEENGILYDHSFMHHDCQPYYLPYNSKWTEPNLSMKAINWMKPMMAIHPSSIIEIPANWHLDDWPPLNVGAGVGQGFVETDAVLRLWKAQFDYYYREYDSFVFPISIHPQVSGKPQVQLMHEDLIRYINSHDGVEWVTLEEMAQQFKEGKIQGAVVEGGVDD